MSSFSSNLQPMAEVLRAQLDEQSIELLADSKCVECKTLQQKLGKQREEIVLLRQELTDAHRIKSKWLEVCDENGSLQQKLDDIDALIIEGVAVNTELIRRIIKR